MDKAMQDALAMDAAMLESMGAGPQTLAFETPEYGMELTDAQLGKWQVYDELGAIYGENLTADEARNLIARLTS
jgi:hypothetical protein